MSKILISAKGISKDFALQGDCNARVLNNINIEVREDDFLAILGPSGSGKSTFLRIIAGLVSATEGSITYLGNEICGVNPGVAMVFQSFALFPWLTVLENVMLGLENKKISLADKQEKSYAVIEMVGLEGFEDAYPKELSGGMRQRVGIGRALVSDPDVLLMDEPFSALDVLTAENLRRDLLDLWQERKIPTKAIILVTHGIEEAVFMADKLIVLSANPATIRETVVVDLPHPRDKKSPKFLTLVDSVYGIMTKRASAETEIGQSTASETESELATRKIFALPIVAAGALTGFLELLDDANERVDLYKFADNLMLDGEDFFPIVSAAELLRFATVDTGDIELTEVGRTFARATLLERKTIFSNQLLQNVPFAARIMTLLQSKSNHTMEREFFEAIIERALGDEVAKKQLDVLIDWGRYAEIYSYDKDERQLYIEEDDA